MDENLRTLRQNFERTQHDMDAAIYSAALRRILPEEINNKATFEVFLEQGGGIDWHARYTSPSRQPRKPNYIFTDALRFSKFEKNYSKTTRLVLYSPTDNREYQVYLKDAVKIINAMQRGWIVGRWTFRKRAHYIGLVLVKEIN